jgi:hypothetical protein
VLVKTTLFVGLWGKGWYYLSHYEKKRIPRIEVIGVKTARLFQLSVGEKQRKEGNVFGVKTATALLR